MNDRIERTIEIGRAVLREIRAENITFMAGSIAYHAFVSLLPLLLLLLVVVSSIGGGLEARLLAITRAVLTPGTSDLLVEELQKARASTSVSLLGFGFLVWGTLRIFRGLDTAFSDIYESEHRNSVLDQLRDGIIVLATFALAILAVSVVETALPTVEHTALNWSIGRLFLVVALSLTFLPMYYVFPDTPVTVREILPGVVVAAVGLTAFESLFRLYLAFRGGSPGDNVVAAVLVLLTWLYVSGLVILLGAVVNAVLANKTRDVDVEPVFASGRPVARGVDHELLLDRLDSIVEVTGTDPITVTVGRRTVTLPAPTDVDVDDSSSRGDGGETTLSLRWENDREAAPEDGRTEAVGSD